MHFPSILFHACCGRNYVSPNSCVEALTSNVNALGKSMCDKVFKVKLGYKGGFMDRIGVFSHVRT